MNLNPLFYLSTNQFPIGRDFNRGIEKIKAFSLLKKLVFIFWIIGPFIYLIERDPADLWLSSIGLIFIIRCFVKNDWAWIGQWWVIFTILLYISGLMSALLGPYKSFSFYEGLLWIRFPIYAAAAQVWLGQDKDIRKVMFISILGGMLLMCIILFLELNIEPKQRLTWPYGDHLPGSYIAKISLPVICGFITLISLKFIKPSIIFFIISLSGVVFVFLTGERGNFLIVISSLFLSLILFRKSKKILFLSLIIFISISMISLASINFLYKNQFLRFTNQFVNSIPIINMSDNNPYWGAWRSGIQQALEKPLIGLGPGSSRKHCSQMSYDQKDWLPGKNYCGNHPHNYYIQLMSETGLIGLIFGSLMFFFIIKTCFNATKINKNCPLNKIFFLIPIVLFFPLQQTGNFFGQWSNLFIWFSLGYSLSNSNNYKSLLLKKS
tara:strand:+ start:112 stop:1422 length:1311 start_codon:yes stop_codon:yes gene_type:complete